MGLGEVLSLRFDCLLSSCTEVGALGPSIDGGVYLFFFLISCDSSRDCVSVMFLFLFILFAGSPCWLFAVFSFRFVRCFFASLVGGGGGVSSQWLLSFISQTLPHVRYAPQVNVLEFHEKTICR